MHLGVRSWPRCPNTQPWGPESLAGCLLIARLSTISAKSSPFSHLGTSPLPSANSLRFERKIYLYQVLLGFFGVSVIRANIWRPWFIFTCCLSFFFFFAFCISFIHLSLKVSVSLECYQGYSSWQKTQKYWSISAALPGSNFYFCSETPLLIRILVERRWLNWKEY